MAAPPDLDIEQAILDSEEAREKKKSSFKIFGRSISDIPCFRDSYLYGSLGGVGVGLGTFMLTSRVRRATDVGFFSFVGITFVYWVFCRYERSHKNLELIRFKHEHRQSLLRPEDVTLETGEVQIAPAKRRSNSTTESAP